MSTELTTADPKGLSQFVKTLKQRLNDKELQFVLNFVGLNPNEPQIMGNYTQSMKKAGYDDGTHDSTKIEKAQRILTKARIPLGMSLLAHGVTEAKISQRLGEGLDAMETKFFAHEGEVTDERDVVNHGERRKHLVMALEVLGHGKASRVDIHHHIEGKQVASMKRSEGGVYEEN